MTRLKHEKSYNCIMHIDVTNCALTRNHSHSQSLLDEVHEVTENLIELLKSATCSPRPRLGALGLPPLLPELHWLEVAPRHLEAPSPGCETPSPDPGTFGCAVSLSPVSPFPLFGHACQVELVFLQRRYFFFAVTEGSSSSVSSTLISTVCVP